MNDRMSESRKTLGLMPLTRANVATTFDKKPLVDGQIAIAVAAEADASSSGACTCIVTSSSLWQVLARVGLCALLVAYCMQQYQLKQLDARLARLERNREIDGSPSSVQSETPPPTKLPNSGDSGVTPDEANTGSGFSDDVSDDGIESGDSSYDLDDWEDLDEDNWDHLDYFLLDESSPFSDPESKDLNEFVVGLQSGDAEKMRRAAKGSGSETSRPDAGLISGDFESTLQESQADDIEVAHFILTQQEQDTLFTINFDSPEPLHWQVDNGISSLGIQNKFCEIESDVVTILEPAIYRIYAKIKFFNFFEYVKFRIFVNGSERIKCMSIETPIHESDLSGAITISYVWGLLKLGRYDEITLRSSSGRASILANSASTFWGLVKLAPVKD